MGGKTEAKMVWLVEDWLFEDEGGVGGKRTEGRRARVDPVASEYINCQTAGRCLREFMRQALRPEPKELDIPVGWRSHGSSKGGGVQPGAGSDSNNGFLTNAEKAAVKSGHNLIRKVLEPSKVAAEEILGTSPGGEIIECSEEERAIFRTTLEQWRDSHWETTRESNPCSLETGSSASTTSSGSWTRSTWSPTRIRR